MFSLRSLKENAEFTERFPKSQNGQLTLGRTGKLTPPAVVQGEVDGTPPPLGFSLCYNISKSFHL